MKMLPILTVLFAIGILSACQTTVRAPSVEVKGEHSSIKVESDSDTKKSSGGFCPPGQAKKGAC